jgi:N-acyl-D-amino-acid deacylase
LTMNQIKTARSVLLENLIIYDGTGAPPVSGDVLISDGKLVAVGQVDSSLVPADAVRQDCKGLCASPGFIDIHSHSDGGIILHPEAECLIRQGITTSVGGNCGGSAGGTSFWTEKNRDKYLALGVRWEDFAGFLQAVEKVEPAVNLAMLFGHGDVRVTVLGNSGRKPTPEEKQKMLGVARAHMEAGAFGISSGLEYVPGRFADVDEMVTVSKPVAEQAGIHSMHMRNEGPMLFEAVGEAMEIAEKSGVRFEISHLKAVGEDNWGKLPKVLEMLDEAKARGVDISADVYPYLASSTELAIVLPDWVLENGKAAAVGLLVEGSPVRERIAAESHQRTERQGGWDKIVVISVENPDDKWMEGLNLDQIARRCGKPPQEQALDILISSRMKVSIIRHSMSEDDLVAAMKHPRVCFVTDGHVAVEAEGNIHPRSIGTYPRILGRYVREKQVLAMEEAIRKMTSLPASKMQIRDRGALKPGMAADVVLFDRETIIDNSTYQKPWQFPSGIFGVFVNGRPVIWEGEVTGIRPGKVLRKR